MHAKLVTFRHRHYEHHSGKHSNGIFWQGHGQGTFLVCGDESILSIVQYSCARQELGMSGTSSLLQLSICLHPETSPNSMPTLASCPNSQPIVDMANWVACCWQVYGPYTKGDTSWRPKPYKEGKGRYLWTDAFGVCNFITQYCETKDDRFLQQVGHTAHHSEEVHSARRHVKH